MSVDCRLSLGNIGYDANFSYFFIYCFVLYLLYCIGLRALCILDAQMCEVSRDIARTTGQESEKLQIGRGCTSIYYIPKRALQVAIAD